MKKLSIITLLIATAGCLAMISCGSNNAEKTTKKNAMEMHSNLPGDSTAMVADSLTNSKFKTKENEEKNEKEENEKK